MNEALCIEQWMAKEREVFLDVRARFHADERGGHTGCGADELDGALRGRARPGRI